MLNTVTEIFAIKAHCLYIIHAIKFRKCIIINISLFVEIGFLPNCTVAQYVRNKDNKNLELAQKQFCSFRCYSVVSLSDAFRMEHETIYMNFVDAFISSFFFVANFSTFFRGLFSVDGFCKHMNHEHPTSTFASCIYVKASCFLMCRVLLLYWRIWWKLWEMFADEG